MRVTVVLLFFLFIAPVVHAQAAASDAQLEVVKHSWGKQIKEIDWDYIFVDSFNGDELDRRQFTSVQNIAPGKQKELVFSLPTPPTRRISIYALDKKETLGIEGRVLIVRVTYADGSVWQLQ